MPAAALAAPVKPKETVKNPAGSTFSPESNSLAPKRDGEDVQVCYLISAGGCPSEHQLKISFLLLKGLVFAEFSSRFM